MKPELERHTIKMRRIFEKRDRAAEGGHPASVLHYVDVCIDQGLYYRKLAEDSPRKSPRRFRRMEREYDLLFTAENMLDALLTDKYAFIDKFSKRSTTAERERLGLSAVAKPQSNP